MTDNGLNFYLFERFINELFIEGLEVVADTKFFFGIAFGYYYGCEYVISVPITNEALLFPFLQCFFKKLEAFLVISHDF